MQKDTLTVPGAILLAGALIAGAIFLKDLPAPTKAPSQITNGAGAPAEQRPSKVFPLRQDDHIRGSRTAPIVIVEYSDTECPFCKRFQGTMNQVMSEYGESGKVAWVYRHFPLHSRSQKESEATECATELGGNDMFWKYLEELFEISLTNDTLETEKLTDIAVSLGLDKQAFNTCLKSGKYTAKVQADASEAVQAGGRGTPHGVIIWANGNDVISGAQQYTTVKAQIDNALSKIK